jgi:hypothetical protein
MTAGAFAGPYGHVNSDAPLVFSGPSLSSDS